MPQIIPFKDLDTVRYVVTPIASGKVVKSHHDRVGIVSGDGGGGGEIREGFSGQIYGSSHFSFDISTTVNTRHEFWLKQTDGKEQMFVLPFHVPLREEQQVVISALQLEANAKTKPAILMIHNKASERTHLYWLPDGTYSDLQTLGAALGRLNNAIPKLVGDLYTVPEKLDEMYSEVFTATNPVELKEEIPLSRTIFICMATLGFGYFAKQEMEWGWGVTLGLTILFFTFFSIFLAKFAPIKGHSWGSNFERSQREKDRLEKMQAYKAKSLNDAAEKAIAHLIASVDIDSENIKQKLA